MNRRIPLAATTYLITLVSFVILWLTITVIQARADVLWRRAGNTGLESEQQALAVLLARANEKPWTVEELAEWNREAHPNLKFALYSADGEVITAHGDEHLPQVDFADVEWGEGDLVVLDNGVELSLHQRSGGQVYYAITRYVLSRGQWWVTYVGYGIGILLTGVIWLVVALLFGRIFGSPLKRMVQTAEALSAGNFRRADRHRTPRRAGSAGPGARSNGGPTRRRTRGPAGAHGPGIP